jgi:indolepyruvate ferredoxin oxidoreductase
MSLMRAGTHVALNTHGSPTAAFVKNPDWQAPGAACEDAIERIVGSATLGRVDAEEIAVQLLGDSIYTNPMMLGYAWQRGALPLSQAALMRAIELNGVQVDNNKAAFEWGRRAAHNLGEVTALLSAKAGGAQVIEFVKRPNLKDMVAKRVDFLTGYQDAAYAQTYSAYIDKVVAAEAPLASTKLSEAVARYLFKLMAYKDEYEVARLHTDPSFAAKVAGMFEGDYTIVHHLAPPILGKLDRQGKPMKQAFGPWMRTGFTVLAKLKGLRGGALDVFGKTDERRTERALITEYRAAIDELLQGLSADRLALAIDIARLPEDIRGYGHVKASHLAKVRTRWAELMGQWRGGAEAGAARRA